MDIYYCSTLRHLMFSILRALHTKNNSQIILALDQQNLDQNRFDCSVLPNHITVHFIERKHVFNSLYQGLLGKLHKACAMLTLSFLDLFKRRTLRKLFELEIGIKIHTEDKLFLFNDRNRMARLMRMGFRDYQVIEDGKVNYYGSRLSLLDRIKNPHNSKRYMGDDKRCKTIHLTSLKSIPDEIAHKVQLIDFIEPDNVVNILFSFFKFSASFAPFRAIIATQPISIGGLTESGFDLVVYSKIVEALKKRAIPYVFKIHPRENEQRYFDAFPNDTFIDSKIPLELLLLSQPNKVDILSIYSTAGEGFESYCSIKRLIKDSDSSNQSDVFSSWNRDVNRITERLIELYSGEKLIYFL